jgi:hypothetical protein
MLQRRGRQVGPIIDGYIAFAGGPRKLVLRESGLLPRFARRAAARHAAKAVVGKLVGWVVTIAHESNSLPSSLSFG